MWWLITCGYYKYKKFMSNKLKDQVWLFQNHKLKLSLYETSCNKLNDKNDTGTNDEQQILAMSRINYHDNNVSFFLIYQIDTFG